MKPTLTSRFSVTASHSLTCTHVSDNSISGFIPPRWQHQELLQVSGGRELARVWSRMGRRGMVCCPLHINIVHCILRRIAADIGAGPGYCDHLVLGSCWSSVAMSREKTRLKHNLSKLVNFKTYSLCYYCCNSQQHKHRLSEHTRVYILRYSSCSSAQSGLTESKHRTAPSPSCNTIYK